MSEKLTSDERTVLGVLNNSTGRAGWPLGAWPNVAPIIRSLSAKGLARERRLGSYPGGEITDAGRAALSREEGKTP